MVATALADTRAATGESSSRIVFLDYLRAVACLLVVLGHVYFMGFNGYEVITPYVPSVQQNIFGPDAAQRNVLTEPSLYLTRKMGINVGTLGVSLFFLISGFVILRAVERETAGQFLVRRFFRIYPPILATVLLLALVTAVYADRTGTTSPHSWQSVLSSAFVLNGYLHLFETTPVLWSLEVELFFYVLMAVLAGLRRLSPRDLVLAAVGCAAFTVIVNTDLVASLLPPTVERTLVHISFNTLEMVFLRVGALIFRLVTAEDPNDVVPHVVGTVALFAVTHLLYLELHGNSGGTDLSIGAWALVIFSLAAWSGMRWRWIRPLELIARISYPLYLVHIPLAWIVLAWLGSRGWGMAEAGVVAGLAVLLAALALHPVAEAPAQRLGRRVSGTAGRTRPHDGRAAAAGRGRQEGPQRTAE